MADSERLDPRCLLGLVVVVAALGIFVRIPRHEVAAPPSISLVLDPNLAVPEVLAALPNLGPARVKAIESARADSPFRSAEDLDRRVKGIGPATIADLKPFLRFDSPPSPLP